MEKYITINETIILKRNEKWEIIDRWIGSGLLDIIIYHLDYSHSPPFIIHGRDFNDFVTDLNKISQILKNKGLDLNKTIIKKGEKTNEKS